MNDEPEQPKEQEQPDETAPPEEEAPQTEEELRERLEQELRSLRVQDVLLQSVASLINLSARRIAKEDERDLDQAKLGIDAVRAVVDLLPDEAAEQVRNALSELQMLYAQHAGDKAAGDAAEKSDLWTPPGTEA